MIRAFSFLIRSKSDRIVYNYGATAYEHIKGKSARLFITGREDLETGEVIESRAVVYDPSQCRVWGVQVWMQCSCYRG